MKRRQTHLLAKENSNRMAQDLAQPTRKEVPGISGPDSFRVEALRHLTEHGINQVALMTQPSRLGLLFAFGRFIRRQPNQALFPSFHLQRWTPVVAIPQIPSLNAFKHFFSHVQVMHIGWKQTKIRDDARQVDAYMQVQSKEGLASGFIPAIGCIFSQDTTTVSPSEAADRDWKAMGDRDQRIMVDLLDQRQLQLLFDSPEIGRLANKGSAMDVTQSRKSIAVVHGKVAIDAAIGIQAQKFADDFYRHDFIVAQGGLRSSLAQLLAFQKIIHQAKDADQKRGNIHLRDLRIPVLAWQPHLYGGLFSMSRC